MPENRIKELEAELLTARASVALLTESNAVLTTNLADATQLLRKAKRNSRSDASSYQDQINTLQSRRS